MTGQQKPWAHLAEADPEVYTLIENELSRQRLGLELIPSENFASASVIAAMGNILANKYAEGLPGKRYYGGCQVVDDMETLAIERAKKLFGARYANVQPHSGAQANAAVYLALLKPGDPILGMDLTHGGHLTHGSKVNFSGQIYESHFYELSAKTERLDYDVIRARAKEVKPRLIVAGASSYPRIIDFAKFKEIATEVGAYLFVDMAHIAGLVAAGQHPSPIPYADVVTSTVHKTLRGPRSGIILWNRDDLNFNKAVFPGIQGGPLEHIIAAKAVCFAEALKPSFVSYQKQVVANCRALAEGLMENGFKLVSGGTDNHLLLINLSDTPVTGKDFEIALDKAGITCNKNTVPYEKRSPFVTSGVRMGTPALTSRGMGTKQMQEIAGLVKEVFDKINDDAGLSKIHERVEVLASEFPLYREWN